ncbi:MAG: TonB-dependent receptor [Cytophagales bacterium]|jgi:hypothetical protein|nr:TonB-dependent receptor [Cytophagales bacterium]
MPRHYKLLVFGFLLCPFSAIFAQNGNPASGGNVRFTLSGFVKDSVSGEVLVGATVFDQRSGKGTVTNAYGFYSLTLPQDSVQIVFSFIGYQSQPWRRRLDENVSLNVFLVSGNTLQAVTVTDRASQRIEQTTQMSSINVPVEQIRRLPAALGEVDVLRTLQLLPGVQKGNEGSTGLYVRGGSPDQNLFLLDGVPLYNVSHLGGLFSVFNADALSNVELIKGGFPARYGGRLSSVLDIRMRDGNAKKIHGQGAVGIISSKFSLEGPIFKDRTTFMVSARRTYLDLLTRPISLIGSDGAFSVGYQFYDYNAKVSHIVSNKDRLYLSFYAGDDRFSGTTRERSGNTDGRTRSRLAWGNLMAALRWNHVFNEKLFVNTTAYHTRYRFLVDVDSRSNVENSYFGFNSGISDWSARTDFEYYPNPQHSVRFGGAVTRHLFRPGITAIRYNSSNTERTDTSFGSSNIPAWETALYAEDDWEITSRLKVNAGLHWASFFVNGRTYGGLQPRVAARYLLPGQVAVKASYVTMQQFIHLLTNTDAGLPTDLWVPATDRVRPQFSQQAAVGVAKSFKDNTFEVSLEGYYKTMTGLIEYQEGTTFLGSALDWQDKVETGGRGESYGAEFLVQKKQGKLSGWAGYTLSWTNRQFAEINGGRWFPYRYDRRHDVGIAATYQPNERITLSASWMYGTGNAITLGTARYPAYQESLPTSWFGSGWVQNIQYYEGRNGFRMRSFHKLDLGISMHKKKRWGERTWVLGLYNAYNRQNPFYYFLDREGGGTSTSVVNGVVTTITTPERYTMKQISLFPIIPSFSYQFKF